MRGLGGEHFHDGAGGDNDFTTGKAAVDVIEDAHGNLFHASNAIVSQLNNLFPRIEALVGGEVIAVMGVSQNLHGFHGFLHVADGFEALSDRERKEAASALLHFRAVRYAEDIGFMANIRIPLQNELAAEHQMKDTTAFTDDAAYEHANTRLAEQYAGFNDVLTPLFNGDHTLAFGPHTYDCSIKDFTSTLTFPWPRAFEVKADVSMKVK